MDDTWLRSRPHLACLAKRMQALLELADELYERGRAGGGSVDYAAFEERVAKATADLEKGVHQVALRSLDIDAPFVRVWGKYYRRVHRAERAFGTLAGPVTIDRTLYREVGKRHGAAVDPVALRAGAVDGSWLPRTSRAIAHLMAQGTSREASATSMELLRLPYSRSSFERVGHAVGREYLRRREHIEPKLIEAYEVPEGAHSISVSVDRTTVPMEEVPEKREAPEPLATPTTFAGGATHKPLDRRLKAVLREQKRNAAKTPAKIHRNYRMAYCATVTLHDAEGEALHTIRYGRMPPTPGSLEATTHRDVHKLMARLRDDVIAIRGKAGELPVVLLADGAPELWNLFARHLNKRTIDVEPVQLVDAWHALEYVAAASRLLESRNKAWPGSFRRWKAWLLTQPGGVKRVIAALEKAGLRNAQDESGGRPVAAAIRYLSGRVSQMRYAHARELGLPIGSGAVEATCKSLISIRMKRPGSRWKHDSGNEILQLRALQLSDRWDGALPRILKPLRKPVHVVPRQEAYRAAA